MSLAVVRRVPLVPGHPDATPDTLRRDWYRRQAEIHGRYVSVLLSVPDAWTAEVRQRGSVFVVEDLCVTWIRTAATFAHLSGLVEPPR